MVERYQTDGYNFCQVQLTLSYAFFTPIRGVSCTWQSPLLHLGIGCNLHAQCHPAEVIEEVEVTPQTALLFSVRNQNDNTHQSEHEAHHRPDELMYASERTKVLPYKYARRYEAIQAGSRNKPSPLMSRTPSHSPAALATASTRTHKVIAVMETVLRFYLTRADPVYALKTAPCLTNV